MMDRRESRSRVVTSSTIFDLAERAAEARAQRVVGHAGRARRADVLVSVDGRKRAFPFSSL